MQKEKEEVTEEVRKIFCEVEKRRDLEAPVRERNMKKIEIIYFLEMLPIIILAEIGFFKIFGPLLTSWGEYVLFASAVLFVALLSLYGHLVKCHRKLIEKDQLVSLCYRLIEILNIQCSEEERDSKDT
jgi:hypothetical protein